MTSTRIKLFAAFGVTVAVAIISHFLASDTHDDINFFIFWGLLALCLTSFIMGFICLFMRFIKLGICLIVIPCIVFPAFFWVVNAQ